MIQIRRAAERGHTRIGWLDSAHTFSFGEYHDPRHMGFGVLRVINEDRVQPGRGFDTHSHRDMEIVTCVIEGGLAHRDSMGNGSVIRPGDLQRMSAGTGVTHSEYNESKGEVVHFLQIWIIPERRGFPPSYEQRAFPEEDRRNRLRLVASRDGRDGSLRLNQDARLYLATVERGAELGHEPASGRDGWLQVVRGKVVVNGESLAEGDGAAVVAEPRIELAAEMPSQILLFDLPRPA